MALEATHIRLAFDLKERYGVKDVKRYIAGTIYPDSRYVAHIDRMATYPEDYLDWDLNRMDDFKKGWFVHLFADHVQYRVAKDLLP